MEIGKCLLKGRDLPFSHHPQNFYLPFTVYHLLLPPLTSLALSRFIKTSHNGFGTFLTTDGSIMSEPENSTIPKNSPAEIANDKDGRSVAEVIAEYEAQLDDVAELVARVRHEINNPLAGILGQAQLLLREELNDKARRRAETIEQLSTRLRDVVAQLRQIQKPVKGMGA